MAHSSSNSSQPSNQSSSVSMKRSRSSSTTTSNCSGSRVPAVARAPGDEPWYAPDMEPDRILHEPEVIVYCNSVFPRVSSSAQCYDVANRRWYRLNVDSEVEDETEWMSGVVTSHIVKHRQNQQTGGGLPPWNVINVPNRYDPSRATYATVPNAEVARPITSNLHYGANPQTDRLPTTTFGQLTCKSFISRSVDRCVWRGRDCAFKRIEFSEDVATLAREIRIRDSLAAALPQQLSSPSSSSKENNNPPAAMRPSEGDDDAAFNAALEARLQIFPILAVVHKHPTTTEVLGILMPYCGRSLEALAGGYEHGMGYAARLGLPREEGGSGVDSKLPPKPWPTIAVSEEAVTSLVRALGEIGKVGGGGDGVMLGDVNDRNILLAPDGQDGRRLMFVDFGEVAPGYKGDRPALGEVLVWLLDRVAWREDARRRVLGIAESLCGRSK